MLITCMLGGAVPGGLESRQQQKQPQACGFGDPLAIDMCGIGEDLGKAHVLKDVDHHQKVSMVKDMVFWATVVVVSICSQGFHLKTLAPITQAHV
jgi:hypothetical protein